MIHDMKFEYPAGKETMIMVCDNIIDPVVCEKLVAGLQPLWDSISYPGRTMGGLNVNVKSSHDAAFSRLGFVEKGLQYTDYFSEIEQKCLEGFQSALMFYKNEFKSLHDWMSMQDTGFQVQKYLRHYGHYREHVDSFPGTESSKRVASGIIYLNTVEHGGETAFPLHNVSVKAVQGRIVIFPALWTHPHEGRVPLSSDKWIINTFFLNSENDVQESHVHDENPHTHNDENPHTHDDDNNHFDNLNLEDSNDF